MCVFFTGTTKPKDRTMTTTLLNVVREHRRNQPARKEFESTLKSLVSEAGVGYYSEEFAEAHQEKLTELIKQPRNRFERWLVSFFARHQVSYGLLGLCICLMIYASIAAAIITVCMWVFNPLLLVSLRTAEIVIFGCFVLGAGLYGLVCCYAGLSEMAIIYWARTDISPWNAKINLPDDVWKIFNKVYICALANDIRGIHYQVEFPCSERIEDPLFLITRGDKTLYLAAFE